MLVILLAFGHRLMGSIIPRISRRDGYEGDCRMRILMAFFGWYGVSLQHQLPALFERLYPDGLGIALYGIGM